MKYLRLLPLLFLSVVANAQGIKISVAGSFTPGGDLSGTRTVQTVVGLRGQPLPALTPGYPHWNGTAWVFDTPAGGGGGSFTPGGDLSGDGTTQKVIGIGGFPLPILSVGYPYWNGTAWVFNTPTGGVSTVYGRSGAVVAQAGDYSFLQIGGLLGLTQLPSGVTWPGSGVVATQSWVAGQNYLTIAPVTTVFGRTGAVTAQTGDYTFAQIGGLLGLGQLPSGVTWPSGGSVATQSWVSNYAISQSNPNLPNGFSAGLSGVPTLFNFTDQISTPNSGSLTNVYTLAGALCSWSISKGELCVGAGSAITGNAITFNNGGAGAASGTTFNGSAARTISYNSIGAVPTTRTVNGHDLSANVVVAANELGVGQLPNGVTAITQASNDSSTKVATTEYVQDAILAVTASATYPTRLTTIFTHSGDTSLANITGWVMPLATIGAGYNANISCAGTYSISTAAAKISLALLDAQTPQSILATSRFQTSPTVTSTHIVTSNGAAMQSANAVTSSGTDYYWMLEASLLQNATTSGALTLQAATSTAADAVNINPGSFCTVVTYGNGQLGSITLDNDTATYANAVAVTPTLPVGAAAACYTTDGTTPAAATPGTCSHGTTWTTGAINITATATVLKLIATAAGYTNGPEKDATYTLTVATPTFSPSSPYTGAATTVSFSSTTTGAGFLYCFDTNNTCTPATSGSSYAFSGTGYVRVKATKTGYNDSAIASWQGTLTSAETITKVGQQYAASGTTTDVVTLSPSITTGQGIIVAIAFGYNASTVTSCTATNATFQAPVEVYQADFYGTAVCVGVATGTVTSVTVNKASAPTMEAVVYSATAIAATNPLDLSVTNSATYNTPTTGTTAGSVAVKSIVFNVFDTSAALLTNGTGYTALDSFNWNHYITTQWKEVTSGTQSGAITTTPTNGDFAALLVTIKEQ